MCFETNFRFRSWKFYNHACQVKRTDTGFVIAYVKRISGGPTAFKTAEHCGYEVIYVAPCPYLSSAARDIYIFVFEGTRDKYLDSAFSYLARAVYVKRPYGNNG